MHCNVQERDKLHREPLDTLRILFINVLLLCQDLKGIYEDQDWSRDQSIKLSPETSHMKETRTMLESSPRLPEQNSIKRSRIGSGQHMVAQCKKKSIGINRKSTFNFLYVNSLLCFFFL